MMNLIEDAKPRAARRRRRLRILAWSAAALVVSGFACWPVLSGRTDPPLYGRRTAEAALAAARAGEAGRWAPEALLVAESAMRASLTINRKQEVKFLLLRDFTAARLAFRLAEEKSKTAFA